MSKRIPTIWIIIDHRIGNVNQCIGVANALGYNYNTKKVSYNSFAKLPNVIKQASLLGIDQTKSDPLTPPWPDIVISAGRRCASAALHIKKQSKGKTLAIQLMWPGVPYKQFDLIAVPEHDGMRLPPNGIETIGAPHKVTNTILTEEKEYWSPVFKHLPQLKIGLIVGGSTGRYVFTEEHAKQLGKDTAAIAKKLNAGLLVSTSRRTSLEATNALKRELGNIPSFFHSWGDEGENPYMGILSCSDMLIVTGDSMSMCSECCFTGKKVFIYAPPDITSDKHAALHQQLYDLSFAETFDSNIKEILFDHINNNTPLNESERIAKHVKELIAKRGF